MKISKLVEDMISEANIIEASDIHFHPIETRVEIHYRIVDKLVYQKNIELKIYEKILRYIKFKSRLDISIAKKPQDGSFHIYKENKKLYIRISTIPLLNSESLVIRILQDQSVMKIKDLAYYPKDLIRMYEIIKENNGLFIFTGPTGSGKTTTMYSILDNLIGKTNKKVITLENPIEIINEKFIQVQINEEINLDYSVCLKSTLRHDPDVIMIGEIRDEETARNVFRAALTGHTVISTLHTKDVYGVIERFLDFGFLKSEIESVLIGISNQRLILDEAGNIKAFYNYVLKNNMKKLVNKELQNEGIEEKITQIFKKRNNF